MGQAGVHTGGADRREEGRGGEVKAAIGGEAQTARDLGRGGTGGGGDGLDVGTDDRPPHDTYPARLPHCRRKTAASGGAVDRQEAGRVPGVLTDGGWRR